MLEKALNDYYEKFGENYPLFIGTDKTEEEIIDEIKTCISNNTLAKAPIFDENCDY